MAAPAQVGDMLRVTYMTRMNNQLGLNVRHYQVIATGGASLNLPALADAMHAVASPLYCAIMCNGARFTNVKIQRLEPPAGELPVYSITTNDPGVAGVNPLPGNCAGVITVLTGFIGRANRGRVYVPFPSQADCQAGPNSPEPTAGYMAGLGALSTLHFGQRLYAVGANNVLLEAVIYRPIPGARPALANATARQKWGSIHRRGSYGKPN